uniref:3'-5' exonuclease n=1 Tax=Wolbachia endosymbiont of Pentidionis agamae TaxID=3110435 RepID=UPI002FCFFDB5
LEVFYTIEENYRNSKQVIECDNRVLHLKNYCFASEDKMIEEEKFFMKSDTENIGNVCFIGNNREQELANKLPNSINWAILVLDDNSKEDARKLFKKTPLIFNIHEAKGLEFENVILYKFMSNKAYNDIWNMLCQGKDKEEIKSTINKVRNLYNEKNINISRFKNKEDKTFENYKFYINSLYIGVTRAINDLYIIDKKRPLLEVIKSEKESNVSIENIEEKRSTDEEWEKMALNLIKRGNTEQAKNIAEKKFLQRGKKEYYKKIIDALKAKGYEAQEVNESQFSLDAGSSQTPEKFSIGKTEFRGAGSSRKSSHSPKKFSSDNTESRMRTRQNLWIKDLRS